MIPPKLYFSVDAGNDRAFSERMESFGFESSLLLVLQFGLIILCSALLFFHGITMAILRCLKPKEEDTTNRCLSKLLILHKDFFFWICTEFYAPALLAGFINLHAFDGSTCYFAF